MARFLRVSTLVLLCSSLFVLAEAPSGAGNRSTAVGDELGIRDGRYVLTDGTQVESGTLSTSDKHRQVRFQSAFPGTPVVYLLTPSGHAVTAHASSVSQEGFQLAWTEGRGPDAQRIRYVAAFHPDGADRINLVNLTTPAPVAPQFGQMVDESDARGGNGKGKGGTKAKGSDKSKGKTARGGRDRSSDSIGRGKDRSNSSDRGNRRAKKSRPNRGTVGDEPDDGDGGDDGDDNDGDYCLCHFPPGNPGNAHTICVGSQNAVRTHMNKHGDTMGSCEGEDEICDDGEDNDGDGLTDCQDPDCAVTVDGPICEFIETICDDDFDNDGDEHIDCDDPDCNFAQVCHGETDCADREDNDGDRLTDCQDPDCLGAHVPGAGGAVECQQPETNCTDFFDNDADLKIDCDDSDCFDASVCDGEAEEICDDGLDNDLDKLTDCQDPECSGETGPAGEECQWPDETSCADGFDNDWDGKTDCDDSNCFFDLVCQPGVGSEVVCDDLVDNDGDRLVDCQDPDCNGQLGPVRFTCEQPETSCNDGLDNDFDAKVDCADSDCLPDPFCGA